MGDQAHIEYTLHLADNALILGHRNSEWTGHGPILEQDIALSNIALDLIGQARYLYQYAARLMNGGRAREAGGPHDAGVTEGGKEVTETGGLVTEMRGVVTETGGFVTEDTLAYGRDAWDFRNCLLVELENGDWGRTILRQFLFSAWQYYFYARLRGSRDRELAAIAEKSVKEVTYHLRWSSEWVVRLGDGTEESHARMERAVDQLWKFTGELFVPAGYEMDLICSGIAVDLHAVRVPWEEKVREVFAEAGLGGGEGVREGGGSVRGGGDSVRGGAVAGRGGAGAVGGSGGAEVWMQTGGKEGRHTEHLGYLLAEMQFLQRAYPGCEW
ncbi:MAG TPA: 1,2-phenylacetyl-CoA epoxidase subunit PaaC [Puia sp.]|nr:1,2-phenylacetyl-CoA epoxidase subunit PaaC [Puia sp.]